MAAVITGIRFGKPDASLSANGWVGGLVASSAACAFIPPTAAIVIGLVAGTLVIFAVEWFELRMAVDDPGGAISVHAVGGIWGVLALGFFAHFPSRVLNVVSGPRVGQEAAIQTSGWRSLQASPHCSALYCR